MKTINGLDRRLLEFYLETLKIEASSLPIIGIRQTENSQFQRIRRDYFILTNDTFGLIGVDNLEAENFLKDILGNATPNFYSGYRPNFYPEVFEIQRYMPFGPDEKEGLDSLLTR